MRWLTITSVCMAVMFVCADNARAVVPTEMLSMDLSSSDPGFGIIVVRESPSLPSPGTTSLTPLGGGDFQIDSFFDVFFEVSVGGEAFEPQANQGSMTTRIPLIPVPMPPGQTFDTEILSMSLSGDLGGIPVEYRLSPTSKSTGQAEVTDLGGGDFQVDSFFDVFFEVSVDGGPFEPQDQGTAHTRFVTPEPTSMTLMGVGLLALGLWRRRKRR